jgi:hypothetical protein
MGHSMQNVSTEVTRRELAPDQIIRIVKERYRVFRYLMVVAGIWVLCGGLMYFVWLGLAYSNSSLRMVAFVLQMAGLLTMTIALAVQRAIYRCPVCDTFLGRKLKGKYFCPNCDTQVKLPR